MSNNFQASVGSPVARLCINPVSSPKGYMRMALILAKNICFLVSGKMDEL